MSIASSSEDTHLKAVIGSTPYARSVPFENNIGGRNIAPTALLDRIDWGQVLDTLRKRRFRVVNPFDKAKAQALRPRRTFDVLSTLVPPIFPAIREARRLLFLQSSPAEGRWAKRGA